MFFLRHSRFWFSQSVLVLFLGTVLMFIPRSSWALEHPYTQETLRIRNSYTRFGPFWFHIKPLIAVGVDSNPYLTFRTEPIQDTYFRIGNSLSTALFIGRRILIQGEGSLEYLHYFKLEQLRDFPYSWQITGWFNTKLLTITGNRFFRSAQYVSAYDLDLIFRQKQSGYSGSVFMMLKHRILLEFSFAKERNEVILPSPEDTDFIPVYQSFLNYDKQGYFGGLSYEISRNLLFNVYIQQDAYTFMYLPESNANQTFIGASVRWSTSRLSTLTLEGGYTSITFSEENIPAYSGIFSKTHINLRVFRRFWITGNVNIIPRWSLYGSLYFIHQQYLLAPGFQIFRFLRVRGGYVYTVVNYKSPKEEQILLFDRYTSKGWTAGIDLIMQEGVLYSIEFTYYNRDEQFNLLQNRRWTIQLSRRTF